jgi:hypothetical protein
LEERGSDESKRATLEFRGQLWDFRTGKGFRGLLKGLEGYCAYGSYGGILCDCRDVCSYGHKDEEEVYLLCQLPNVPGVLVNLRCYLG